MRVEMPGLAVDHERELAPGEQVVVGDVVAELGLSGSGSLRVFSAEPLTVASRTYAVTADGTFGQFLGGVTGPGGLANGDTAVLMHLREDAAFRSNIGILNAGRREARVRVILFDGDGLEVARFTRSVEGRQIRQLNRPFEQQGGRSDVESGYAVIEVLDGEEVVVYASVVDNGTNDPTTVPMKTGAGTAHAHVAAAANGDGAAGSVWRTDLGVLNPGDVALDAVVVFHPSDGPDLSLDLSLQPGEQRMVTDVVGAMGGEGSGSLQVAAGSPVMVSSRTYNESSAGTFGQYLDGIGPAAAIDDRLWLPQLQQNDDFRTNIGLYNVGAQPARVKVHLYDGQGILLKTTQRTVEAGERLQLQEPFDRLAGRNDIDAGWAMTEVVEGEGLVAYGSVIDNRTNDPTTVPMVR
jgi:hypothetical protein